MRLFLSTLIALFYTSIFAQSPVIKISTEKIKENGVVKYVHNVKSGETLYSLAKAYKVTQEQIISNNPQLKNGLKEGTKIFIPSVEAQEQAQPQVQTNATVKKERHQWREPKNKKVSNPETKSTATAAPIVEDELQRGSNTMAAGMQSLIKPEKDPKKVYKKHTVRKNEVIDDIAAKYKISVEALMEFNSLKSATVKKKQVLYIPDKEYMSAYEVYISNQGKADVKPQKDTATISPVKKEEKAPSFVEVPEISGKGGKANVAFILPVNMFSPNRNTSNYIDFYSGALLAAESLKSDGYNVTVNLVDQSNGSDINTMLSSNAVAGADFVIGPIHSKSIQSALSNTKTPFVSPLDQHAEVHIKGHSNFIQSPASNSTQIENISALLLNEYNNSTDKIIFICQDNSMNSNEIKIAKGILDSSGVEYNTISYNILDGRAILPKFRSIIKEGYTYRAFVVSNDEAFVNDVARNLNLCAQNNLAESASHSEITLSEDLDAKPIDVVLYGLPKWRNFETIEPYNFHNLNLRLSLPYYVDYSLQETKEFLMKYRAICATEPSPFAYQGYDITKYFIKMFCKYGPNFIHKEKLDRMQMIQSNFNFIKESPSDGFINKGTTNIVYNKDFSFSVIY